ncbi:MAG: T9SS type A sorting domain-containing protein [bacterium]
MVTTDLGATWTQSRTGMTGAVNALVADPADPNRLYSGNSTGVFRSTDRGATWTLTTLTRNTKSIVIDEGNTAILYAGTYGHGVQRSTDGGTTWTDFSTGLTNNKVLSLALRSSDGTLMAGTEGGSVFRTGVPTAIAQPRQAPVPRRELTFSPNPLRGEGVIEFAPRVAGPVTAAVYDHSGRCVLELGTRTLTAAPASWRVDARELAAGTYFVRLAGPDGTRTARFVKAD